MKTLLAAALAIAMLAPGLQAGQRQTPQAIRVSAAPTSARPGDVVVLTITTPPPAGDVRVRAFDRDLPVFQVGPATFRGLVGVDLGVAPGRHPITVDAGTGHAVLPLPVTARRFLTRVLTVDPEFVNPPASAVPRIQREAAELERLWQTSTTPRLWDGAFVAPVPEPANSAFGTRTILNGEPRSPHAGADFGSPAGTPIKAPNAGNVVLADALYYTGNTVVVDHGLGLYSLFAHLSEVNVAAGTAVERGQTIGAVGATGRATGPHLHWSVRLSGARVDPVSLLAALRADRR